MLVGLIVQNDGVSELVMSCESESAKDFDERDLSLEECLVLVLQKERALRRDIFNLHLEERLSEINILIRSARFLLKKEKHS